MKQEVWLRTNRRVLYLAMVLPGFLAAAGALVAWNAAGFLRGSGLLLLAAGGGLVLMLAFHATRPRMAYGDGRLRFWLRSGPPLEVPLEIVECFFLGQADAVGRKASLPAEPGRTRAVSVVTRLAEGATQFRQGPVKPALGRWADGYIIIRGTWCEPLSLGLVQRLNEKLRQAQKTLHEPDPAGG